MKIVLRVIFLVFVTSDYDYVVLARDRANAVQSAAPANMTMDEFAESVLKNHALTTESAEVHVYQTPRHQQQQQQMTVDWLCVCWEKGRGFLYLYKLIYRAP